ncbi:HAD family phosphatase [Streptomyces sp. NPDC097619]|uniref:HAD family hydrolase n=1 Tax=Streptomyces sp. NPDC097619 TaxID=3157228 RepID=UPI00332189EB
MSDLAAVLFDMDGTLVDTEGLWWRVTEELAASLGHRLGPADAPEVVGRAVEDTAAHLARVTGTTDPAAPAALAEALGAAFLTRVEEGTPLRPGAQALLTALEAEGVPFALVSASPRTVVDSVTRGALGHVPFALTLSADDVARTKPHPEPYLAAAGLLGVPIEHCVAVEDSPDGAASAEAAGCPLLVVPSLLPVPPSPRRRFADSLAEVDPPALRAWVTAASAIAGPDRTAPAPGCVREA